ncbi:MAG: ester cyclase [Luteimonas sp.]
MPAPASPSSRPCDRCRRSAGPASCAACSFGSGDWTVATGVLEATFSVAMKMPDGKSIPPTGRQVKMSMATTARWANGCIAEEHLFCDNAEYMKQLGLSQ